MTYAAAVLFAQCGPVTTEEGGEEAPVKNGCEFCEAREHIEREAYERLEIKRREWTISICECDGSRRLIL